jgi:alkanesulfonate monooxygenase SsuD/methylene tetrahydromethanopterin reductase-like flavin-dependent oxidoreductase (luciferase family)
VSNVSTRHVSALASALLTLCELSGDRVALGVGTGDSSLRTLGAEPATRRVLAERIDQPRQYLSANDPLERLVYASDDDAGARARRPDCGRGDPLRRLHPGRRRNVNRPGSE